MAAKDLFLASDPGLMCMVMVVDTKQAPDLIQQAVEEPKPGRYRDGEVLR